MASGGLCSLIYITIYSPYLIIFVYWTQLLGYWTHDMNYMFINYISDPSHKGIAGSHLGSAIGIYRIHSFRINVSRAGFDLGFQPSVYLNLMDDLSHSATTAGFARWNLFSERLRTTNWICGTPCKSKKLHFNV